MSHDQITVDTHGSEIEVTTWSSASTGLSVFVSPGQAAALIEKIEALSLMQEYRRQKSQAAAREAQSHHAARASRR